MECSRLGILTTFKQKQKSVSQDQDFSIYKIEIMYIRVYKHSEDCRRTCSFINDMNHCFIYASKLYIFSGMSIFHLIWLYFLLAYLIFLKWIFDEFIMNYAILHFTKHYYFTALGFLFSSNKQTFAFPFLLYFHFYYSNEHFSWCAHIPS